MHIADLIFLQRSPQWLRIELRIAPRSGDGADIHDKIDLCFFEQLDEFIDTAVRVADSEESVRHLCTSLRMCLSRYSCQ